MLLIISVKSFVLQGNSDTESALIELLQKLCQIGLGEGVDGGSFPLVNVDLGLEVSDLANLVPQLCVIGATCTSRGAGGVELLFDLLSGFVGLPQSLLKLKDLAGLESVQRNLLPK